MQLALFQEASPVEVSKQRPAAVVESSTAGMAQTTHVKAPSVTCAEQTAPVVMPLTAGEQPTSVSPVNESESILRALHAESFDTFREALQPLITEEEAYALHMCHGLPWQAYHHVYTPIIERLTFRWGALQGGWQPFARVLEPSKKLSPKLLVVTLELFRPSRGLSGNVAFAVHPQISQVTQPIPLCVLELYREYRQQGVFKSVAFLEPIFESARRGARVLRSQAEVRRIKCRPKDPLVVGFLGDPLFRLRLPVRSLSPEPWRASSTFTATPRKPLIFLLGHWD